MTRREPDREAILRRLTELSRRHLQFAGPLRLDTSLAGELAQDSLARLTLLVEVENAFCTCIADDEASGLTTVGELVELLAARPTQTQSPAQNPPQSAPGGVA